MSDSELSQLDRVHGLFVQHSSRIRGFILAIAPNIGRADDLLQETFLTVSKKSDDYVSGSNFVAWACAIARYKVLEDFKRQGNALSLLSPEVLEAVCAANAFPRHENGFSRMSALQDCLTELSPHTRRAVELRYNRAHNATEIATILGWSKDSVYVVLSRARGALQACIKARLELNS